MKYEKLFLEVARFIGMLGLISFTTIGILVFLIDIYDVFTSIFLSVVWSIWLYFLSKVEKI